MAIRLMKKIDGKWYEEGVFTEKYQSQLLSAYRSVAQYADDVRLETVSDLIRCGECAHLYVKGMGGFCPYMNGTLTTLDYCSKAKRKERTDD